MINEYEYYIVYPYRWKCRICKEYLGMQNPNDICSSCWLILMFNFANR